MTDQENGLSLPGLKSQLLHATPSVEQHYQDGGQTVITGYQGREAQVCRYLLNFGFIVAAYLFFSPFVFFILSFSIIPDFGKPAVRNAITLKSVTTICDVSPLECFRFYYFAFYVAVFGLLFFVTTFLFLKRRDKHPLRARSVKLLSFTVFSIFAWEVWSCLGIMYESSWLGCTGTHIFNNLFYPMMILPYWFRAFRIKKLLEQATVQFEAYADNNTNFLQSARTKTSRKNKKNKNNKNKNAKQDNENNNNKKLTSSSRTHTPGTPRTPKEKKESLDSRSHRSHRNQRNKKKHRTKSGKHRSRFMSNDTSINTTRGSHHSIDDISMDISIESSVTLDSTMTNSGGEGSNLQRALYFARTLENRLLLYLIFSLCPFVILSIFNVVYGKHFHVMPAFSSACDTDLEAMVFWISLHLLEILLLLATIYLIRLVWRAFSVKQELTWVVVLDVVFCACMLGFDANNSTSGPSDGVLTLYCVMMRSVGLFVISVMWPLYRSYFPITLPDIPSQDVITSLQAVLDDVEATVQFRRFMTEQDAQYLLDCWMEIDLFKDAWHTSESEYRANVEKGNNEALKIYLKYFDINNNSKAASGVRHIVSSYFCKSMKKIFDKILVQKEQRELRRKLRKNRNKRDRRERRARGRKKKKGDKLDKLEAEEKQNDTHNNTNTVGAVVTANGQYGQYPQLAPNTSVNYNGPQMGQTGQMESSPQGLKTLSYYNDEESPLAPMTKTESSPFGPGMYGTGAPVATTPTTASSIGTSSFDESLSVVVRLQQSGTRENSQSLRDESGNGSLMNEIESEELMRVESNVFDYPQTLLFNHMENLHYRLFLRSEYCKNLLRNLQTKEAFFRQLINEEIL